MDALDKPKKRRRLRYVLLERSVPLLLFAVALILLVLLRLPVGVASTARRGGRLTLQADRSGGDLR